MLDLLNNSVCDAHFHIVQCRKNCGLSIKEQFSGFSLHNFSLYGSSAVFDFSTVQHTPDFPIFTDYYGLTCAHEKEEFLEQEKVCQELENFKESSKFSINEHNKLFSGNTNIHLYRSFGIHPQMTLLENADFLEELLKNKKINAIGECGFDFFTEEYKNNRQHQIEAWNIQLELAEKYNVPIVVHCRKGLEEIYKSIPELSKLSGILMHSFFYGKNEALSLIRKLPSVFFSFGKQLLNGNKKALGCVQSLPLEKILLETDAPFQTLKNEKFTVPDEILRVYEKFLQIRGITEKSGASEINHILIQLKSNLMNFLF